MLTAWEWMEAVDDDSAHVFKAKVRFSRGCLAVSSTEEKSSFRAAGLMLETLFSFNLFSFQFKVPIGEVRATKEKLGKLVEPFPFETKCWKPHESGDIGNSKPSDREDFLTGMKPRHYTDWEESNLGGWSEQNARFDRLVVIRSTLLLVYPLIYAPLVSSSPTYPNPILSSTR